MRVFEFRAFERTVRLEFADPSLAPLFEANFGAMRVRPRGRRRSALCFRIARHTRGFAVDRGQRTPRRAAHLSDLLFVLEKEATIALQRLRRDLYFIHGAALERAGKAVLLVAASGVGKSTTAWALLHHGFRYMSDELAPIDAALRVHPYPHALCVKSDPPDSYPLPPSTVRTSRTLHVPVGALPADRVDSWRPLDAIFFIEREASAVEPRARRLSEAEATARLYAQALNPLAHSAHGLDAAAGIAARARCFELRSAKLQPTAQLVASIFSAGRARRPNQTALTQRKAIRRG